MTLMRYLSHTHEKIISIFSSPLTKILMDQREPYSKGQHKIYQYLFQGLCGGKLCRSQTKPE